MRALALLQGIAGLLAGSTSIASTARQQVVDVRL
jgi:divalent metal cation (Fe/Co/Zn/Cd) transporter